MGNEVVYLPNADSQKNAFISIKNLNDVIIGEVCGTAKKSNICKITEISEKPINFIPLYSLPRGGSNLILTHLHYLKNVYVMSERVKGSFRNNSFCYITDIYRGDKLGFREYILKYGNSGRSLGLYAQHNKQDKQNDEIDFFIYNKPHTISKTMELIALDIDLLEGKKQKNLFRQSIFNIYINKSNYYNSGMALFRDPSSWVISRAKFSLLKNKKFELIDEKDYVYVNSLNTQEYLLSKAQEYVLYLLDIIGLSPMILSLEHYVYNKEKCLNDLCNIFNFNKENIGLEAKDFFKKCDCGEKIKERDEELYCPKCDIPILGFGLPPFNPMTSTNIEKMNIIDENEEFIKTLLFLAERYSIEKHMEYIINYYREKLYEEQNLCFDGI